MLIQTKTDNRSHSSGPKNTLMVCSNDDPRKCTAAKIHTKRIKHAADATLLLNPFAKEFLLPSDKKRARSITAVDCSWRLSDDVFERQKTGLHRRLPPLFAGNPVNYAKLNKLTTAEAISGALYMMDFRKQARMILEGQKWGHTFFDLNASLLDDYAKLGSVDDLLIILEQYGIKDALG